MVSCQFMYACEWCIPPPPPPLPPFLPPSLLAFFLASRSLLVCMYAFPGLVGTVVGPLAAAYFIYPATHGSGPDDDVRRNQGWALIIISTIFWPIVFVAVVTLPFS